MFRVLTIKAVCLPPESLMGVNRLGHHDIVKDSHLRRALKLGIYRMYYVKFGISESKELLKPAALLNIEEKKMVMRGKGKKKRPRFFVFLSVNTTWVLKGKTPLMMYCYSVKMISLSCKFILNRQHNFKLSCGLMSSVW